MYSDNQKVVEAIRTMRATLDKYAADMQNEQKLRVEGFALAILLETGGKPSDFTMHVGTKHENGAMVTSYQFVRLNRSEPEGRKANVGTCPYKFQAGGYVGAPPSEPVRPWRHMTTKPGRYIALELMAKNGAIVKGHLDNHDNLVVRYPDGHMTRRPVSAFTSWRATQAT